MISRELSPPVPKAGRSGEIPMLSIPASIRVSVADHTPFDRRVYVPLPYSWPQRGLRGVSNGKRYETPVGGSTPKTPHSLFVGLRSGGFTVTFEPCTSMWLTS